jgi:acetylxylan esterase
MRHSTLAGLLIGAAALAGCGAGPTAAASHSGSKASASARASAGSTGTIKKTAPFTAAGEGGTCAAVHIIAARASTEPPGDGIIGSLVTMIQHAVKTPVTQEAVVYPATLTNYPSSVGQGDVAMKVDLVSDAGACPRQRFILVGYSQGAQVVGDTLAGGGGPGLGPATPGVSPVIAAKVIAGIQMGDPRRMPNLSFDAGTDPAAEGLFPRLASQSLVPFAAKLQSYCDVGDPYCAKGNDLAAHLDYTFKYDSAALTFVLGKLHAAGIR